MENSALLALLRAEHADLDEFIAAQSEEERAQIGTLENWAPKDLIAHLASAQVLLSNLLDSLEHGEAPRSLRDLHRNYEAIFAANQDRAWEDVVGGARQAHTILAERVQQMSDTDLEKPSHLRGDAPLWQIFVWAYVHDEEHLKEWLIERNDLTGATRVVERSANELMRAVPTSEWQGLARYNLACFYARNGMEERGLRHLKEAVTFNPALIAWAKQDADLATLYNIAEYQALFEKSDP